MGAFPHHVQGDAPATVYTVLVAVLLAGIHINLADNDTKPASVYLNRTVTEHV